MCVHHAPPRVSSLTPAADVIADEIDMRDVPHSLTDKKIIVVASRNDIRNHTPPRWMHCYLSPGRMNGVDQVGLHLELFLKLEGL